MLDDNDYYDDGNSVVMRPRRWLLHQMKLSRIYIIHNDCFNGIEYIRIQFSQMRIVCAHTNSTNNNTETLNQLKNEIKLNEMWKTSIMFFLTEREQRCADDDDDDENAIAKINEKFDKIQLNEQWKRSAGNRTLSQRWNRLLPFFCFIFSFMQADTFTAVNDAATHFDGNNWK